MSALHHRAYFLVGPTAAGKTVVAQRLAELRHADILSADSMLVYRGMDIGTAKPSIAERNGVRYWGVDLADPSESFNAARFMEEARRCFEAASTHGNPVIVAGGTGLYVKALLQGLDELPAIPEGSRGRWQTLLEAEGVDGLQKTLRVRNPRWFESLADRANSRRLIRALELIDAGCVEPPRSWVDPRPEAVITGLEVPRDERRSRIGTRVRAMYVGGLLQEARALLDRGWDPSGTAAQAIGYAEAIACLKGTLTVDQAMEETARRTRQLAKRQMTWFRHQAAVSWIQAPSSLSVDHLAAQVASDWDCHGPQPVCV